MKDLIKVAIHNKNGKGLLQVTNKQIVPTVAVAIHNKNGKGLLLANTTPAKVLDELSQSTIKMEKGYYLMSTFIAVSFIVIVAIHNKNGKGLLLSAISDIPIALSLSQSTIKMEKGYYCTASSLTTTKTKSRNPQ